MKRIAMLGMVSWWLTGLVVAQPPAGGAASATVNMAAVAQPSASSVSGDTSVAALNDEHAPRGSRDNRSGSYGNWPNHGTQWVQYDWSRPISTNKIDVYWWADGRGIAAPKACRLLYWNDGAFVPVVHPVGLGLQLGQFNTTAFDEVTTAKLRLEMDSEETSSTGILEWKVYDSGKSPDFPPGVTAGIDRVVVLGGKTYLSGAVRVLKSDPNSVKLAWSKESGPGTVTFAQPDAAVTTATFSAAGDYVLKLSAGEGGMASSSTLKVTAISPPPADRLDVVYTKRYKIDNPLWNDRAKALIVTWIPHCIDMINDPNLRQGGINNFIEAAKKLRGEPAGRHRGFPFSNAWVYQTVESMCIALMVDPQGDPDIIKAQGKMKATLEDWIPKILAAQEPDGYLQTRFTLDTRGARHWDPRTRGEHEGYVAGYFIESAINHYTLTNVSMKPPRSWPIAGSPTWVPARRSGTMATRKWSRPWCGSAGSSTTWRAPAVTATATSNWRNSCSTAARMAVNTTRAMCRCSSSTRRSDTPSVPLTPIPGWRMSPRRRTIWIIKAPS
jgi:hypothetical protein